VFSFPFITHDTIFLYRGTVVYVDTCFQCFLCRQVPCTICNILQYFFGGGAVLAMGLFYFGNFVVSVCCEKKTGTNKIQIYSLKRGVTSSENKFQLLPAQGHYILSQKS